MQLHIAGPQRPIRNAIAKPPRQILQCNRAASYTSGILPRLKTSALRRGDLALSGAIMSRMEGWRDDNAPFGDLIVITQIL